MMVEKPKGATHGNKVHLTRFPDLCTLVEFVPEVQYCEKRNVDVCDQEIGHIELEEYGKPVDEDEQRAPEDTPYRQPRLLASMRW